MDVQSLLPHIRVLDGPLDIRGLDELLLRDGLVVPAPTDRVRAFPHEVIQYWCHQRAVYQVPTVELIDWLREFLGERSAIEIGAGNAGIGRALGIPATDSYLQCRPEIQAKFAAARQVPVEPPSYVEKREALAATQYYRPDVVLGAFITQKWQPGMASGSQYAPDTRCIRRISAYLHIGNAVTHGDSVLLREEHRTFGPFPWLISRSNDQAQNRIWYWEKE